MLSPSLVNEMHNHHVIGYYGLDVHDKKQLIFILAFDLILVMPHNILGVLVLYIIPI